MCEHPIMNNGRLIQQEHKRAEAYESELKLDKDQDSGLVYLTPDNAAKIEARIHLNPRYKKTVDDSNEKSTKFIIRQLKEGKLLYNKDNRKATLIIHYSLAACGDFIIHSSLEKSREINE